jgi:ABC-type dipeptide/oligopeptide/nickel transport system permease subunit
MRSLATLLLRAGTMPPLFPGAAMAVLLLVVLSTNTLGDALVERLAARRAAR